MPCTLYQGATVPYPANHVRFVTGVDSEVFTGLAPSGSSLRPKSRLRATSPGSSSPLKSSSISSSDLPLVSGTVYLCGKQGLYGRPERPKRLIGRQAAA